MLLSFHVMLDDERGEIIADGCETVLKKRNQPFKDKGRLISEIKYFKWLLMVTQINLKKASKETNKKNTFNFINKKIEE